MAEIFPHGLWEELTTTSILPVGGNLIKTNERELKELVNNIEKMVNHRESNFQQKLKKIHKHFEKKNQECLQQKMNIDENTKQITKLEYQVDHVTTEKQALQYYHKIQMDNFQSKAVHLRNMYERLYKTFQHKIQKLEEFDNISGDRESWLSVDQLSDNLKKYENELEVIKEEKEILVQELDSINCKNKELQEKCERLETLNNELCVNIEKYVKEQKQTNQEIERLSVLLSQQDEDLKDFGKSDDLLKRAVIALRVDTNTKQATINNLTAELKEHENEEQDKIKKNVMIKTLQINNNMLHEELKKYKVAYSELTQDFEEMKMEKVGFNIKCPEEENLLDKFEEEKKIKMVEMEQEFERRLNKVLEEQAREMDEALNELHRQLEKEQKNSEENEHYYHERVEELEHMNAALTQVLNRIQGRS